MRKFGAIHFKQQTISLLTVVLLIVAGLLFSHVGYSDELPTRSLELSNTTAGAFDTYQLQFTLPKFEVLGSISLQFCSNNPIAGAPCTVPTGFNATAAVLASQAGQVGFTIVGSSTTSNRLVIGRTPLPSVNGPTSYTFTNVKNPSNSGPYFARIQTFASNDGSGAATDFGGLAFDITNGVSVTATVPPYLYFCLGVEITGLDCSTAAGSQLNFGTFSSFVTSMAATQMVAATNADTGYVIAMFGSTLTSGNDTIPALSSVDVSRPGTSQFGVNLRSNSDPSGGQDPQGGGSGAPTSEYNQQNKFKFANADIVAKVDLPDLTRKYTTSYIANISKSQAPGTYVSTITYVATGSF